MSLWRFERARRRRMKFQSCLMWIIILAPVWMSLIVFTILYVFYLNL